MGWSTHRPWAVAERPRGPRVRAAVQVLDLARVRPQHLPSTRASGRLPDRARPTRVTPRGAPVRHGARRRTSRQRPWRAYFEGWPTMRRGTSRPSAATWARAERNRQASCRPFAPSISGGSAFTTREPLSQCSTTKAPKAVEPRRRIAAGSTARRICARTGALSCAAARAVRLSADACRERRKMTLVAGIRRMASSDVVWSTCTSRS